MHGDWFVPRLAAQEPGAVPVRVHAEQGPEGLFVWVGLDRKAAEVAGGAEYLLAALRRELHAAGQRLSGVVFNGNSVYGDAPGSPADALRSKEQS